MAEQIIPYKEKINSIRQFLQRSRDQIATALPKHLTADRMLRLAMTAIQKNPALLDCTQTSLIGAIMQASQLGLEVDILGQAYLVPFKGQVTLIPGYRGLIKIARNSGEIADFYAVVVHAKDEFSYRRGTDPMIHHVPFWQANPEADDDPGPMIGAYSVAFFKDPGCKPSFEFMTKREIDRIRAISKQPNGEMWAKHYDEAARKTVIRRHTKTLPGSVELERALELNDSVEMGISQNLGNVVEIVNESTGEITEEKKPVAALDAVTAKLQEQYAKEKEAKEAAVAGPSSDGAAPALEPWQLKALADEKRDAAQSRK